MTPFSTLLGSMSAEGDIHRVNIPEDWQQGRTTFGGMTGALCLAATAAAIPELPPLRSAYFTFVGPAGGHVEIVPRLLRRGRSSVFATVELSSEGALATQAALSFAAARDSKYTYRSHPLPTVPAPGTTEVFFRSSKPKYTHHFEAFVAGGQKLVSGATTPEIILWVRHRDRQAMAGLPGLIALADTLPAAAYTMLSTPVPASSVTWSVEMINPAAALNAAGDAWYLLRSAGEDVRGGYSVQDMALWAQDGTLIMLGRQMVAIFG